MQARLKISFGGILILLSIYFGMVASEIIAFLNTTTTSSTALPYTSAFFMGFAIVLGFIGFYMISENISSNSN
ncbi:MAG: hypothetical protein ACFFFO_16555 [Candidatus Thorarchaeota archaeon]